MIKPDFLYKIRSMSKLFFIRVFQRLWYRFDHLKD